MNIWHNTADAPRSPRRVSPTQNVELTIGTWHIRPEQAVRDQLVGFLLQWPTFGYACEASNPGDHLCASRTARRGRA